MIRQLLLSLFFLFSFGFLGAQQLELIFNHRFEGDYHPSGDTTGGSDCWGWTGPDGEDYAIFGTFYGTHYVRASDGAILDSVPGAILSDYYYHRDIKTYRNYAYVVGEMTGAHAGVQIVDLSYLPDSVHLVAEYTYGAWPNTPRSHNLSIDTAKGYAYVMAPDYTGVRIISLANPTSLSDVGFVLTNNIHDAYARNDTLWCAEGYNQAFSVWDVSDKSNPVKIGQVSDPNFGYCHQIWASPDGKYFETCEETPYKTVKIWDAHDMSNITMVGQYLGHCNLVHNGHWMGDSLYFSHYESGFTVVNVSDPAHPVEVASWDTYALGDTSRFYGCWGAFPFSKNGYMYSSNIEGWMQIYRWNMTIGREADAQAGGKSWPNPFTNTTRISLPAQKGVENILIYDSMGRQLVSLPVQHAEGMLQADWNAAGLPMGVYVARAGKSCVKMIRE